jgi:transposase
LEIVAGLAVQFQDILGGRVDMTLKQWMKRAKELCPGLTGFVRGLGQDQQAVDNAVSMDWSQGPTEGHVNRIKTLKRQMYGRAGLDLLERRLILAC